MIIDFHTHTFPDAIAPRVVDKLAHAACSLPYTDGTAACLAASMKKAGVDYSVNLPVMTSVAQVAKVNASLIRRKEELAAQGILTFGGMHPDDPDYRPHLRLLADAGLRGVKLHPAYQGVDLDDIRYLRIISAAEECGLIVLLHAGIDIGIYDHNYSSVDHILTVLRECAPTRLVLAHMGNWACWDQVESDLLGAPVWLDTAFTVGSIAPCPGAAPTPYGQTILSDADFLRISRKHGVDRILFATDSPWQDQSAYVAYFGKIGLTEEELQKVMGENAAKLLGISSVRSTR